MDITLRLWIYYLDAGKARELTVEGTGYAPFWSPDSRFIAYPFGNKLRRIEATGGPPQTVCDLPGSWAGGAWNQNDVIVFGSAAGVFRGPAGGGVPVRIIASTGSLRQLLRSPDFLPDGRHFLIRDAEEIYAASLESKSLKPLVATATQAVHASSQDLRKGYLLFMQERTLMAQPFDSGGLELTGQPAVIAEQVADSEDELGGKAAFSTSATGVLVYQRGAALNSQLTWFDREGKMLDSPVPARPVL